MADSASRPAAALADRYSIERELGAGGMDGVVFYVMPYVEGESLRDRLTRKKQQLPMDMVWQIARETADALSYAHSRGVVHRDIKPENPRRR